MTQKKHKKNKKGAKGQRTKRKRKRERESYQQIWDYDAEIFGPGPRHMILACCDCGLVHRVEVYPLTNKYAAIRFIQDARRTAALRRHKHGNLFTSKGPYRIIRTAREGQVQQPKESEPCRSEKSVDEGAPSGGAPSASAKENTSM